MKRKQKYARLKKPISLRYEKQEAEFIYDLGPQLQKLMAEVIYDLGQSITKQVLLSTPGPGVLFPQGLSACLGILLFFSSTGLTLFGTITVHLALQESLVEFSSDLSQVLSSPDALTHAVA